MARYCIACGAGLNDGARFCGNCGAPVPDSEPAGTQQVETGPLSPPVPPPPAAVLAEPLDAVPAEPAVGRSGPNWLLIGGGTGIVLLLLLYYFIFLRDDMSAPAPAAATEKAASEYAATRKMFVVADANVRDKPAIKDGNIVGKLPRGSIVNGTLKMAMDGTGGWFELADGKGFVSDVNLSETQPPEIVKPLGDRMWNADRPVDIYGQPDAAAPVLDHVAAGTPLMLFGLTANGYVEIKLKKGGVGYLADGARIAEASNARGKPIAISFNPASCNFGGELEVEFGKLAAQSRAAYEAADNRDYPSDAARDQALGKLEGKSYYQKLERSWNGLSITGIAQHYESQSLYFADSPDKVIAAFRAAGHKIDRTGAFPATEIYAGIGATAGEGRGYGKTDLSCGV